MKIVKVAYNCHGCGKECETTNHNLRYRQHNRNDFYCFKCLLKLQKSSAVFDAIPPEFHCQVFAGVINYEIATKYLIGISTNAIVKFTCRVCSKECSLRWSKMSERKHNKSSDICHTCSQRAINNDPVALGRNSRHTALLWLDQNFRAKSLRAFLEHNKRMQTDVEYAAKHRRRSRSVSGIIKIGDLSLRFDSGFELIFAAHISSRCATIRRCEFAIAYENHFYHPDFFIIHRDGSREIAEIKGYYRNNIEKKHLAALRYIQETGIADSYVMYDTNKLISDSIVIGTGGVRMWKQIREIISEFSVTFTEEKHREAAKRGRWRSSKKTKD